MLNVEIKKVEFKFDLYSIPYLLFSILFYFIGFVENTRMMSMLFFALASFLLFVSFVNIEFYLGNPINTSKFEINSYDEIESIDLMDGKEFENYMGEVYGALGYTVLNTQLSGDQGADLIISKDGMKKAIQTKRSNKKINNKAIQEVVAAKYHYGCDSAAVVTNNYFTSSAIELAESNHVILVDRDWLIEMLESTLKRAYSNKVF